jgi:hypothetical protein
MTAREVTRGIGGSGYRPDGAGNAEDDDGVSVADGPPSSVNETHPAASTKNAINRAAIAPPDSL